MIRVEFVRAWPDRVERLPLELPDGACLGDARAKLIERGWLIGAEDLGIWGRREPDTVLLTEGDRLEAYRPVQADPKAARLSRAREQGYRWQARTRRAVRAARDDSSAFP